MRDAQVPDRETSFRSVWLRGKTPRLWPKERYHYPVTVYILTVLCGLGLACVALGITDGWVLIAACATVIIASLLRLHVILDRRRMGVVRRLCWIAQAAATAFLVGQAAPVRIVDDVRSTFPGGHARQPPSGVCARAHPTTPSESEQVVDAVLTQHSFEREG